MVNLNIYARAVKDAQDKLVELRMKPDVIEYIKVMAEIEQFKKDEAWLKENMSKRTKMISPSSAMVSDDKPIRTKSKSEVYRDRGTKIDRIYSETIYSNVCDDILKISGLFTKEDMVKVFESYQKVFPTHISTMITAYRIHLLNNNKIKRVNDKQFMVITGGA